MKLLTILSINDMCLYPTTGINMKIRQMIKRLIINCFNNCFLTTKIAYANMVGDIAKSTGCNPNIILKAVRSDSRISDKNLKYGYGGPCFPQE